MALTAAQLATALRIHVADPDDIADPGLVEAARLLAIATPLVTAELNGSTTCSPSIVDEAIIRVAGHVFTNPNVYGHVEGLQAVHSLKTYVAPAAASVLRQSGARALLGAWRKRTA